MTERDTSSIGGVPMAQAMVNAQAVANAMAKAAVHEPAGEASVAPPCPCSSRTLEAQNGRVVWRAIDKGEWCGNPAQPYTTMGGDNRNDGWCEDCITKVCEHCRHD